MKCPAILVTNSKGGVGKTLVSVNLAISLSKNVRVALIDADIGAPNVTYVMGIADRRMGVDEKRRLIPYNYSDTLQVFSMENFFARGNGTKNQITFPGEEIRSVINQSVNGVAWNNPDIFVIDSPPATSDALIELVKIFGTYLNAIIVSTNHNLSVSDAERVIQSLMSNNVFIIGIIGNMIIDGQNGALKSLSEKYQLKYLGEIPFDIEIMKASDNGQPGIPYDVIEKTAGDILYLH